jgi:predicted RNase H-like HicB family nuclease
MKELIFEITQESDGGFCAEALGEAIFTQGDTWEQMRDNVREATEAHFHKRADNPASIRLRLVRDEVLVGGK